MAEGRRERKAYIHDSRTLQALVERIAQLPPAAQDRIAETIEDALDNAEWHALLADPRSEAVLDALIAEAERSPKHPWPATDCVRANER